MILRDAGRREVRIAKSAVVHTAKIEHDPIPHGRSLVVWTLCGIQAFEETFTPATRCADCKAVR